MCKRHSQMYFLIRKLLFYGSNSNQICFQESIKNDTTLFQITACRGSGGKPWASCQMRKIASAHAPGMPGTFSPPPRVSDPDMHHGTCVTHVPWCMPGSLTSGFLWSRWWGKTFPAFPAHAQSAILRIWQEAHYVKWNGLVYCAIQSSR